MSLIEEYLKFLENDVDWFYRNLDRLSSMKLINPLQRINLCRQIDFFTIHEAMLSLLITTWYENKRIGVPEYNEGVFIPLYNNAEKEIRGYYSTIPSIQKQFEKLGFTKINYLEDLDFLNYKPSKFPSCDSLSFSVPSDDQLERLFDGMFCASRN